MSVDVFMWYVEIGAYIEKLILIYIMYPFE